MRRPAQSIILDSIASDKLPLLPLFFRGIVQIADLAPFRFVPLRWSVCEPECEEEQDRLRKAGEEIGEPC